MTISYPINIPNPADIAEMTLVQDNVVGASESPFTFNHQIYQHQGQRWGMTVELNPLARASAAPWRAWLSSLMGAYGTFLMGDPTCIAPRGSAGGTPIVSVASQVGNVLTVTSAEVSVNSWMLPGDYIQLGSGVDSHIHRILNTVTTSVNGWASVDIWPRLRSSPASGATVIVQSTVGAWRLVPGSVSETLIAPNNTVINFSAVEVL